MIIFVLSCQRVTTYFSNHNQICIYSQKIETGKLKLFIITNKMTTFADIEYCDICESLYCMYVWTTQN